MFVVRDLLIVGISIALAACGGGGEEAPSNANPQGIWYGQKHSQTTGSVESVRALVLADGTLHALADREVVWDGVVAVTGTGSASLVGGQAVLATTSFPATLSNRAELLWRDATVSMDRRTMQGVYSSGGDTGEFTLRAQDPLVAGSSRLADLAGAYRYKPFGSSSFLVSKFRIEADGAVTGTETRGTFTGTVRQIEPERNAYRVSLSYFDLRFPGTESKSEYVTYFAPDLPRELLLFNTAGGNVLPLEFVGP